jgi:hypothetical protein
MIQTKTTLMLLASCLAAAGMAMAADTASSDWPQWRGPTRDGVAGPGSKLADAWPEGGPKLLWKSEPIPCGWEKGGLEGLGGAQGGLGSVTVVGDKAFVFVDWKSSGNPVVITTKDLNDYVWSENVPDDFGAKVDEEAQKHNAFHRKPGETLDAVTKEFLATLDPKLAENHGAWIKERFAYVWNHHPNDVRSWVNLAKVATIRDRKFATYDDLVQEARKQGFADNLGAVVGWADTDLIYKLKSMGNTYTDTIICLNVSTGKELWKREFAGVPTKEMVFIGASGTPAVWDGKVYASGSAGMYCVSANDGSVIWQAKTSFTHSSPLVANGGVFLMLKEGVTAYDAKTGKLLWTQPKIGGNPFSSVAPWSNGGKNYVIAVTWSDNACLDQATGEVAFRFGAHNSADPGGSPVISGDIAVITPGITQGVALSAGKGEPLWAKFPGCSNAGASPAVYQGYVYQAGIRYFNTLICRDLKTGEYKWGLGGVPDSTSAIIADGKGFCLTGDHRLMMFKASPEKFELLGLGGTTDPVPHGPTPSIANGRLYVRLTNSVACYDITAAANPVVAPPKRVVSDAARATTVYRYDRHQGHVIEAVSSVDKGDSIELTDKTGKVTTVKKADIDDVLKPGMGYGIR